MRNNNNRNPKTYYRTSIDIVDLPELKKHCLENGKSLKGFINEAIDEKLKREMKQTRLSLTL